MNLTFNEEIFKNCRNKEQYFQYIEELVWLGREVQNNGIMAFESEKWQNVTVFVIFLQSGGISETEMKKLL